MLDLNQMGARAKEASRTLATASASLKNSALEAMAAALTANAADILRANEEDVANGVASGMSVSLQDRLRLTEERIKGMAAGGETSGDGQTSKKVSYNDLKPGQTFTATGKDGKRHRYRKTENGYERIN